VAVENRIVKIQKRNRALVTFDPARIHRAILRAGESIGGFQADHLPGINDTVFQSRNADSAVSEFLTEVVVISLNSERQHLISNFPPTIETIQDRVLHVLRSYGLQHTADAYECYRWGRHWLREGAISGEQFVANGFPRAFADQTLTWNRARGCDTVQGLNEIVRRQKLGELVGDSLAVYETSIDRAAEEILRRLNQGTSLRLIWIAGPSASGKTTTTVKLTERLQRQGLKFLMLNLDDYFWSLVDHPTDWINDRNYETPEAMDIQLLNRHLRALLEGETIEKPIYSFKEGRTTATKPVRLARDEILLLDCLHGLYPPITEGIAPDLQFRLYVETENSISLNSGVAPESVRSTDVRLMRRLLRDVRHRNHGPLPTILHWHYVRAGEFFSIIPLRGLADAIIHAGFSFELAALKTLLSGSSGLWPGPEDFAGYSGFLDARIRFLRISRILEALVALPPAQVETDALIPGDAPIREFIGGSSIKIPHNE
jgi:uridine kinase